MRIYCTGRFQFCIMDNEKNREEYLERVNKIDRLKLVIVGQDPYPQGANGIAFCKNTFEEFFDLYCCGKEVLFSLGYTEEYIVSKYKNPLALFCDLLSKGIAFINVSSLLLDDATELTLKADILYNENFLSKTDKIVVLGKSNATRLFKQYYSEYHIFVSLIHPSGLAKKHSQEEWENRWDTAYLKTTFSITFNAKRTTMELDDYFNLDLPSFKLYSKGNAIEGVHGIELVNGEYFASHFHLKTEIAKEELRKLLENSTPKELYSNAQRENVDFKDWPEVKYEGDSYSIKKYKLSWLLEYYNQITT